MNGTGWLQRQGGMRSYLYHLQAQYAHSVRFHIQSASGEMLNNLNK